MLDESTTKATIPEAVQARQPEAIAARLVTQHDRRIRRQVKMLARAREFSLEPRERAGWEQPHASGCGDRWRTGQAPAGVAEIQGDV
jgi:hypothetical protein